MLRETVLDLDGTNIITESGTKLPMGNRRFEIGEEVWTDGCFAFGNERRGAYPAPFGEGEGSSEGALLVWSGLNDDSECICRIYGRNMSFSELPGPTFANDSESSTYYNKILFCYNAAGTRFAWLAVKQTGGSGRGESPVLTMEIKELANGKLTSSTVSLEGGIVYADAYYSGETLCWRYFYSNAVYSSNYIFNSGENSYTNGTGFFAYYNGSILKSKVSISADALKTCADECAKDAIDSCATDGMKLEIRDSVSGNVKTITGKYQLGDVKYYETIYAAQPAAVSKTQIIEEYYKYSRHRDAEPQFLNFSGEKTILSVTAGEGIFLGKYLASGDFAMWAPRLGDGLSYWRSLYGWPLASQTRTYTYTCESGSASKISAIVENVRAESINTGADIKGDVSDIWLEDDGPVGSVQTSYNIINLIGLPAPADEYTAFTEPYPCDDSYTINVAYAEYPDKHTAALTDGSWSMDVSGTVDNVISKQCFATALSANSVILGTNAGFEVINKNDNTADSVTDSVTYNTRMPLITSKSLYELTTLLQTTKEAS